MTKPFNSNPIPAIDLPIFRSKKNDYILLIGKNPETCQTLSRLLDSQGYEVVTTSNLTEAFNLICHRGFAFILFDWFLEGERGLELCRLIRTINKKTPIYFYTTSDGDPELKQRIEAQVVEYSVTYFDTNPVLKVIFRHLQSRED